MECEHLFVRRRDGVWCAYCGLAEFGRDLTPEERERLKAIRAASSPDVSADR